jgi:hypothetical protein
VSKVSKYKLPHVAVTGILLFAANFTIVLSGIISIMNMEWLMIFLKFFICKAMVDFLFLFNVAFHFRKLKLMWYFLPAFLFEAVYIACITFISLSGSFVWKGRRVK